MNKFFVIWGWCLSAILIIENMVSYMPAYVFINSGSSTYMLSIVSTVVGLFIWFWLKWMLEKPTWDDESLDF